MKCLIAAALLFASFQASAQHYYKDIVGTKETSDMMKAYLSTNVRQVSLVSYDENNTRITDFQVDQQFNPSQQLLQTTTRSGLNAAAVLLSYIDPAGRVVKTVDSSSRMVSTTVYKYNGDGQLLSSLSQSTDSARSSIQSEEHIWQYNNNRVSRMFRIKNRVDTAVVEFKLDEQGNVIEEQETRKGVKGEPVYYYYDGSNRLTDIVRFNKKARRLLPEYLFEYSEANRVIQKITIPSNSGNYLIWRYQYNGQGLKTKEVIYNKQKQVTGKIEYQYSFGS